MNTLQLLVGAQVVLDAASPYVYVGRLESVDEKFVTLSEADVHDLRDSATSRDLYLLESKTHGIRVNRRRVHVRLAEIVSISALDDVVE